MSGVVKVGISDIVCDPEFQIRGRTVKPATVREYTIALEAGAKFPPVKLMRRRDALVLVDGWHRIAAHEGAGCMEINAVIVGELPVEASVEDVRYLAGHANMTNGLQMTRRERREMFRAYVRSGRYRKGKLGVKSYREIRDELQQAVSTIAGWMRKDFPQIAARMAGEPSGDRKSAQATRWDAAGQAQAALRAALAAYRGLDDEEARGGVIAEAQAVVEEMKAGAPWREPRPEDF